VIQPAYAVSDRVIVDQLPMTIVRVLPILDPRTFERAAYGYIVAGADGTRRIVTEGEIDAIQPPRGVTTMSLERYCACGAKLRIKIDPAQKERFLAAWFVRHQRATCRPATRKEWREAQWPTIGG
jgi:hypothetical protein